RGRITPPLAVKVPSISIAIIRGVLAMLFRIPRHASASTLVILSAAKDPLPLPCRCRCCRRCLRCCVSLCFLARHPDRAKRRGTPTAATNASPVLQVYRPHQLCLLHGQETQAKTSKNHGKTIATTSR